MTVAFVMSSEMIEPPFIQMKGSERKMVLPTSPPPVMAKPDLPSLVSFVAASTSSSQVCGGLSGSSPAALKSPLL